MPSYKAVNLSLSSQFDVTPLPEFAPSGKDGQPKLEENEVVSVYVPVLPGSQFWISYSINEPFPPLGFFYFKLFINGAHIVSWGTGEKDSFKGKTMFAIYDAGDAWVGKHTTTEKRGFFFAAENGGATDARGNLEVKVYRAKGRKRMKKETQRYHDTVHGRKNAGGLEVSSIGQAKKDSPKRFYKYALADPVDKPFATFRYLYRTWDELAELGVLQETSDESNTEWHDSMENIEVNDGTAAAATDKEAGSELRNPAQKDSQIEYDVEDETFGFVGRPKRLSIPPSRRLLPTTNSSFPTPSSPKAADYSQPVVESAAQEAWMRRSPSPVKGNYRDIDSPTPGRKRTHATDMLRDVVANALRRRPSGEKLRS